MNRRVALSTAVLCVLLMVLAAGCRSGRKGENGDGPELQLRSITPAPSVKFGTFSNVEIKPFSIAAKHSGHKGNDESRRVMTAMLSEKLGNMFGSLKCLPAGSAFSGSAARTLQITPHVEDIRIVSGAARFWVGAMAGASHVLVSVTFRDSSTGAVVARPQFFRKVSGYVDVWGAAGNRMRDEICGDILVYVASHK